MGTVNNTQKDLEFTVAISQEQTVSALNMLKSVQKSSIVIHLFFVFLLLLC